jgi:hypothetical protein
MTELTTAANFQEVVRDRIKSVLFDSIPDGQVDKLIQNEYKAYFEKNTRYNTTEPSPFSKEVSKIIKELMSVKLKEELGKIVDETWNGKDHGPRLIKEAAAELAPIALEGMMTSMMGNAISSLRAQIQSNNF